MGWKVSSPVYTTSNMKREDWGELKVILVGHKCRTRYFCDHHSGWHAPKDSDTHRAMLMEIKKHSVKKK